MPLHGTAVTAVAAALCVCTSRGGVPGGGGRSDESSPSLSPLPSLPTPPSWQPHSAKKKTLKSPWGGKGGERPCWHPPQVPSTFCGGACTQGGSLLSAAAPTMGVAASLICAPTFWRLPPSVGVTTPRGSARGNGRFHLFTCLSACDGRGSGGVAGGDPPAAKWAATAAARATQEGPRAVGAMAPAGRRSVGVATPPPSRGVAWRATRPVARPSSGAPGRGCRATKRSQSHTFS